MPRISRILAMLLPRILPMAIWLLPWKLANRLTNNSGVEVPNATMVRPMAKSEILNLLAMEDAPSTSQSAPLIRAIKPIMRSKYVSILLIILHYLSFFYEKDRSLKKNGHNYLR